MNNKDYYYVLGVNNSASKKEIDDAYRTLVLKYHPDRIQDLAKKSVAEEKMKEINHAYDVIGNETRRKEYDYHLRYGGSNYSSSNNSSFSTGDDGFFQDVGFSGFDDVRDIFKKFFSFGDEDISSENCSNNSDAHAKINITFEEWFNGLSKTIEYSRNIVCKYCNIKKKSCDRCIGKGYMKMFPNYKVVCTACKGAGNFSTRVNCNSCTNGFIKTQERIQISIPPFCGTRLIIEGVGNESIYGTSDLELSVSISPHSIFKVSGNDIIANISIGLDEFIYGSEITFTYLDGKNIKQKIQPFFNEKIVYKNKGIVNKRSIGSLILNFIIKNNCSILNKSDFLRLLNCQKITNDFFKRT